MKKENFSNKIYFRLFMLVPMFLLAYALIYTHFDKNQLLTVYGVETVEMYKATGDKVVNDFKIKKIVLTSGEVIDYPTLQDIKDKRLFDYRTTEDFQKNVGFEESTLN
jgi:hypothetical protein